MKTRYDLAAEKAREAIEELRLAAYERGYKDARHDFTANRPIGRPTKSPQEFRDDIVAQAKRDVADLQKRMTSGMAHSKGNTTFKYKVTTAEFHVNTQKRVVAVLVKGRDSGRLFEKGIAKCDPSDCFNVHIGKAIALRRALGLEVPAEYYQAPQPTEVRDYDKVLYNGEILTITPGNCYDDSIEGRQAQKDAPSALEGRILDDSREACPQ